MCNAHCSPVVDLKAIAMALEKDNQDKDKASNTAEERGDAPPAVGVVKSGVVGSAAWTAGRYVAKDGQRFRIGRGFETMLVFDGQGAPAAKKGCDKKGRGCSPKTLYLTSTRILYFYTNFPKAIYVVLHL